MKKILALAILLAISACYSTNDATKALTESGYTDIVLHGHAMWSCSKDDTFSTEFEATSPSGVRVTGAVCSGWFKGKTIRLD
jgi:hypothetical protein